MQGSGALLEVAVLHLRDLPGADEGGADRLEIVAPDAADGMSPETSLVSSICKESELPARVMLRLNDGFSTTGGELTRLVGLAEDYLAVGAEGLVFGFLDTNLEVDVDVCLHLAERLPGVPWTFHRAIDSALSTERAWRRVRRLPGLDAVRSAGSPQGMDTGFDDLVDLAGADPGIASLMLAGGGLRGEHVPWLVRAGVRQFHVGLSARSDRSWTRAYVDAGHVRSWRMLLDDALDRALGKPLGNPLGRPPE